MRNPDAESVERDPLAGGMTRPAVIRGIGIPFWHVLPCVGVPLIIVGLTWNPCWLLLIGAFVAVSRGIVERDHQKPRLLWLALISGALFADRHKWGGDTVDPARLS